MEDVTTSQGAAAPTRTASEPFPVVLERLYEARFADLTRVAATITGSAESGRDAVQEAFARALRRPRGGRVENVDAWIWRIVVNCARDQRRSDALAVPEAQLPEPSVHPGGDGLVSARPDVVNALRALPERQLLVVLLRHYGDLNYRQIAEVLGIRTGTVSATLHAAHERLRALLEDS